ncbi:Hypothetical predicted protein, partial [Pelobates cultripes]
MAVATCAHTKEKTRPLNQAGGYTVRVLGEIGGQGATSRGTQKGHRLTHSSADKHPPQTHTPSHSQSQKLAPTWTGLPA